MPGRTDSPAPALPAGRWHFATRLVTTWTQQSPQTTDSGQRTAASPARLLHQAVLVRAQIGFSTGHVPRRPGPAERVAIVGVERLADSLQPGWLAGRLQRVMERREAGCSGGTNQNVHQLVDDGGESSLVTAQTVEEQLAQVHGGQDRSESIRPAGRKIDRQTDRQTDKQRERDRARARERVVGRDSYRQTDRQTTSRQTNEQTDRQNKKKNRQKERKTTTQKDKQTTARKRNR